MIATGAAQRDASAHAAGQPPAVHRREARAMGSPLRLQVPLSIPSRVVERAWRQALDEFEASEQALSRFRETSEIHQARIAGGRSDTPSRRLVAAISAADRARRVTDGRFEPRVLGDLERLGSAPIAVAPPALRAAPTVGRLVPTVGRLVRREGRTGPIDLPVPIDFGGIGKGLALRWAARRLEDVLGGSAYLLEAGGDIVAAGSPARRADDPGWRIGIEDPRLPASRGVEGPLAVIELPDGGGAVATSSVRRARWQSPDGRAVHHLIDPATGEPGGAGLLAVTVHAPDPAWSEVWSKALFLEGARGIAARARSQGLAAWWVTAAGMLEMTAAARARTVWVAGETA
ncbi:MAG: FAD:protein FMN transferase [Chloroflexi bacterium]|nr:FAD:protein FMN transferase [Chloroflexota bacterium]